MESQKKMTKRPRKRQALQQKRTPRQKRHCAGVPPRRYQHSPEVISHHFEEQELTLISGMNNSDKLRNLVII